MEIPNYINKMKQFQEDVLEYIDDEEEEDGTLFPNIIDFFTDQKKDLNRDKLRSILDLLSNISKNHHRTPNFFTKIEQILLLVKDETTQFFTNFEIFKLFEGNKRIILFLFEQKILKPDKLIADAVQNGKLFEAKYHVYFFPELNPFYEKQYKLKLFTETYEFHDYSFDVFNKLRKIGENDKEFYELIRSDSIDEFVTLVNKRGFSLSSTVQTSLFETNHYLLKHKPKIIEYAAFYGAIQIFRYLYLNEVDFTPSLWYYVIHGKNPELIHILEEKGIIPNDSSYEECVDESIKCYHKEFTTYIYDNLMQRKSDDDYDISIQGMKYKNYLYFPDDLINEQSYYYFCKYNYIYLYKLLLKMTYLKINTKIISKNKFFFNEISKKKNFFSYLISIFFFKFIQFKIKYFDHILY